MIVLDTHVLLWADSDDWCLGRRARALIERRWATGEVAVAAISFLEVGLLQARGRLSCPLPFVIGAPPYLRRA